jgi:hypothetical protein
MNLNTKKVGVVLASLTFGFGLRKIPKVKNFSFIKDIANKSSRYGIKEGKRIIEETTKEMPIEFVEFVDYMIENEKRNQDDIKVVFLEDEEKEIPLLPPHEEHQ